MAAVSPDTPNAARAASDASHHSGARFTHAFATSDADIIACQKLRYQIFAGELGANIDGGELGIDQDRFDEYCHHLMVRDAASGEVIASTRVLTCEGAERAGRFYSAGEFEMSAIANLPGTKVEIGRTCVRADFRNGAVIATLWQGLAGFVAHHGYTWMFGCASIGLEGGGETADVVLDKLNRRYMSPPGVRVTPKIPYHANQLVAERAVRMPPLLKAYVSLGAKACGAPYWDKDFNCCDVFMLLNAAEMSPRYARRFNLGTSETPNRDSAPR